MIRIVLIYMPNLKIKDTILCVPSTIKITIFTVNIKKKEKQQDYQIFDASPASEMCFG